MPTPAVSSAVPLPQASDAPSELPPSELSNGIAQPLPSASTTPSSLPLIISLPISYFNKSKEEEEAEETTVGTGTGDNGRDSGMLVDCETVVHPIAGKKVEETGGEVSPLVIRIPRDSVRFSSDTRRRSYSPISSGGGSVPISPAQVGFVRPEALLVTLDRTLLPRGNNTSAMDSVASPPGTVLADSEKIVLGTHRLEKDTGGGRSYMLSASPRVLSPTSPSAPTGRLKGESILGVPASCLLGVDGCLGANKLWYDWTEAIPSGGGFAVNVLPYVYVDGWDPIVGGGSLDILDSGKETNPK